MFDKLKSLTGKAKDAVSSAVLAGDLNGDGKVDAEDARIAAEWAKKTANSIGDEASRLGKKVTQSGFGKETGRLGKEVMRSDLAKDVAAGASIGAVIAIPLPIIGPMAGAAIGAGLGVYKNFTRKGHSASTIVDHVVVPKDVHAELLKLYDLWQKGIITEAEFEIQKKTILDAST